MKKGLKLMTVSGVVAIGLWMGAAASASAFGVELGSETDGKASSNLQSQVLANEVQLHSNMNIDAHAELSINLEANEGAASVEKQVQADLEDGTEMAESVSVEGEALTESSISVRDNAEARADGDAEAEAGGETSAVVENSLGDAQTNADVKTSTSANFSANVTSFADNNASVKANASYANACMKEELLGSVTGSASGNTNTNLSADKKVTADASLKANVNQSTLIEAAALAEKQAELQAKADLSASSELELNAFEQFILDLSNKVGIGLQVHVN
ncbi:MAG TPA: hypothetical protein VNM69_01140 [Bacillus sp. (in: firmicutes)]|uniref:hypothetical protein n=1 Tax=Bacillus litorisediminis TaxID=2922713 RepID=UPI001FAF7BB8|nr:hypothetical protein [Bacillus litorisediminis]HWO74502.1 hypothetical protein [Bacillus sp. (in: firmicutes)]